VGGFFSIVHMKIKSFSRSKLSFHIPYLLQLQKDSWQQLWKRDLGELFEEMFPVYDYTSKQFELNFVSFKLEKPKYEDGFQAKENDDSFAAPLRVKFSLKNLKTGEIKEQEVFMADFPLMTEYGTFVINGVERVVIPQLIRSSGVFFTIRISRGLNYFGAKIIPSRGAWLEFDTDSSGLIGVRINRQRKVPATTLLRAFGLSTDELIKKEFKGVDKGEIKYIEKTLARDSSHNQGEAYVEVYKKLRPGDLVSPDAAKDLVQNMFCNFQRYDLSKVGRWKIWERLSENNPPRSSRAKTRLINSPDKLAEKISKEDRVLKLEDLAAVVKEIIRLNNDPEASPDQIDHLGNRRIRNFSELCSSRIRVGLMRMERIVKDRMSTLDVATLTPSQLINPRPVMAIVQEFFASSQFSQFMDAENPLAETEHKRRLTATGPGGLTRERAGFEVRDVHSSHYGRMCPIETPEGPNIGLIGSLATYATLNEYGFIETPYRKVEKGVVTENIEYLSADQEEDFIIAQATQEIDAKGKFKDDRVLARSGDDIVSVDPNMIDYMDVSPRQIFSAAASLIPFLEHDDANRALMGSNMQRQAVPLIDPEPPLVGTGMEKELARDSGTLLLAMGEGVVKEVHADRIIIDYTRKKGVEHNLYKFRRSNQGTCINQMPLVKEKDKVERGQVIADGPSTCSGELSLGKNLRLAFMSWEGYNYEDAIIISERLVKEDILSSIHISKQEVEARSTKLGNEEITRDIPSVGEEVLKNLDERGIIRIGAEVKPGDVLVGKITPKGETELTAEEKLLRAIFGEKAREVRDSSLKVPHGESGKVVDVQVFSRKQGHDLPPGVNELVRVFIAEKRKISIGDKLAGRHGNKGVISVILPEEDMPYTEDGEPIDIIFNPLGVPSRMNVGQVMETHLGLAAMRGWETVERSPDGPVYISTPIFEGASEVNIKKLLKRVGINETGKTTLYDGRSGGKLADDITVGYAYVMKLLHLVDDKIHARSTGPYSLVTQQPLGGKAQFGGQRFGEMEVWALEAYGAAYALQEMLTIKSDDVTGRVKTYEAIVKGENIEKPGIPESFKVLIKEMQSLGLDVEVLSEEGRQIRVSRPEDEIMKTVEELGINLEESRGLLGEQVKEKTGDKDTGEEAEEPAEIEEVEEKKAKPELTEEEKEIQKQIEAGKKETKKTEAKK